MSLQYSITRKLMRHAKFYNEQILPFFQATPRFAVQAYCLRDNKELIDAVIDTTKTNNGSTLTSAAPSYLTLQDIIRQQMMKNSNNSKNNNSSSSSSKPTPESITFAMNSLRLLSTWKTRMSATSHATFNLPSSKYKFEVGDIVQHSELHHLGVVAAKMPICFETEDWINENLGSVNDYRLSHPWYLILVARHDPLPFDFVRYGSELTHVKSATKDAIGCHRMLPMFFSGFCGKTGRYLPREVKINEIVQKTLAVRNERVNTLMKKQQQQQVVAEKKLAAAAAAVVSNNNGASSRTSAAVGARRQQQQSLGKSVTKKKQQQQQKQASSSTNVTKYSNKQQRVSKSSKM